MRNLTGKEKTRFLSSAVMTGSSCPGDEQGMSGLHTTHNKVTVYIGLDQKWLSAIIDYTLFYLFLFFVTRTKTLNFPKLKKNLWCQF